MSNHPSRTRPFYVILALLLVLSAVLGACAMPAPQPASPPQVVKETVIVTQVIEKEVIPTPAPMVYRDYVFHGDKFPDGTTVTYMAGMSVDQQRTLREDAKWFKQATNIDLKIELGDDAKFNALVAAGTPPDLYYCSTPGIKAADGTFMPIDDYIDPDFLNRFPQEFIDGFTGLDGKLYGVQFGGWFPVVMINTKMIEEVGEAVPDTDWTWDDVVRIGQKVTRDVNGNTPLDEGFDPENAEIWGFWAGWFADDILPFSNGARRFDETGTRSLVDDPKFIEAWRWWSDLWNTYRIQPPNSWLGAVGQSASELFMDGKLAMFAEGINYDLFRRAEEKLGHGNWKIVAYPHPADHDLVMSRYQGGACVSSKTANPAATVEALKFLATAGYPIYPNLWLKDSDVVGYWLEYYPFLADAGYREAMEYTLARIGPEPWHGKAAPFNIDRYTQGWDFWNQWGQVKEGKRAFDDFDFAAFAQEANQKVVEGMERDLKQVALEPTWREALEKLLAERKADLGQ